MSMYPYWLNFPEGWDYPASCASDSSKNDGWAASVDLQRGIFSRSMFRLMNSDFGRRSFGRGIMCWLRWSWCYLLV
jgi:hypothetical protein